MNEYKFPFWKQPKLYNFFFDVADKYVAIRINIFGFDYGKYKVCTIFQAILKMAILQVL